MSVANAFEQMCQKALSIADGAAINCKHKMIGDSAYQTMEINHNGVPMTVEIKITPLKE